VTVAVARKLNVPRLMLIVNKVPAALDPAAIQAKVERAYGCPVAAVLPHSDEMMLLASSGIFALHHPDHPLTALYRQTADQLIA
jgi:MinD-like ATPase involved in chromosome partitioning or flagellar assembly